MPFDTVVFDLDGTLVDSAPDLTEALNRTLADHGLPAATPKSVRSMVGEGAVRMIERGFAAAGRPLDDDTLRDRLRCRFLDHYGDCLADSTRPFPGVVATLEALAGAGRRLAVCTNKPEAMSRTLLDRLDLTRFFPIVLGGDSLPVRKPDPRHLTETIRLAGGAASGAAMVGDSFVDVDAARAAGIPVGVVTFGYSRIAVEELDADARIDHVDGLIPALAQIARSAVPRTADERLH